MSYNRLVKEYREAIITRCQVSKQMRQQSFNDRKMKSGESIYSYSQELKSLFRKDMGDKYDQSDMPLSYKLV